MKYEDMSDFEINKWVWRLAMTGKTMHCHGSIIYKEATRYNEFDPCNSPSDAWPIIVANKITIIHNEYDDMHMTCSNYNHSWCHEAGDRIVFDNEVVANNPLRAAMICFLKMKDAQQ